MVCKNSFYVNSVLKNMTPEFVVKSVFQAGGHEISAKEQR